MHKRFPLILTESHCLILFVWIKVATNAGLQKFILSCICSCWWEDHSFWYQQSSFFTLTLRLLLHMDALTEVQEVMVTAEKSPPVGPPWTSFVLNKSSVHPVFCCYIYLNIFTDRIVLLLAYYCTCLRWLKNYSCFGVVFIVIIKRPILVGILWQHFSLMSDALVSSRKWQISLQTKSNVQIGTFVQQHLFQLHQIRTLRSVWKNVSAKSKYRNWFLMIKILRNKDWTLTQIPKSVLLPIVRVSSNIVFLFFCPIYCIHPFWSYICFVSTMTHITLISDEQN